MRVYVAKEILEDKRFFLCSIWMNITFIWSRLKLISLLNFISQTFIKIEEALTQKDISLCIHPIYPFPVNTDFWNMYLQGSKEI